MCVCAFGNSLHIEPQKEPKAIMSELLKELETLKTRLIQLGYHPDELEHILHENVPSQPTLTREYLQEQIDFLRSYLQFAAKSVNVR